MSLCIKLCKEVGGGHIEQLLQCYIQNKDLFPFTKFFNRGHIDIADW